MIVLFLLLILTMSTIYKPSCGLMVYMIIRLCIPPSARYLGFSLNTIALAIFIILSYKQLYSNWHQKNMVQKKYVKNIFLYVVIIYILSIMSSITASVVPIHTQLVAFTQFTYTELFPSVIIMLFLCKEDDLKIFDYVLWGCAVFASSYAVFTFFTQSNPLVDMFATSETINDLEMNAEQSRGLLIGTGVGLLNDKITTSIVEMLFFTYFWSSKFINKYLKIIILILSSVSLLLTSQRSAMIGLLIFIICMVLSGKNKIKKILTVSFVIAALIIVASIYFEQFDLLVNVLFAVVFIWDDGMQEKLGVGGSTMELRIGQLFAVFKIIGIHILEGVGYDIQNHREFLNVSSSTLEALAGFESIIFAAIAQSGLIGL